MRATPGHLRAMALLTVLGAGWAGCSGPQRPGTSAAGDAGQQGALRPGAPHGRIEGELERTLRRKHMRIWGQVQRIRRGVHGQLPPITATASGGQGDPVTKIRNQTHFKLTIWFAGKCSHQVEVQPATEVTAIFCAGKYNLAAMVDDRAFLPLVREDQDFENGVQYRLDFFVKKEPR